MKKPEPSRPSTHFLDETHCAVRVFKHRTKAEKTVRVRSGALYIASNAKEYESYLRGERMVLGQTTPGAFSSPCNVNNEPHFQRDTMIHTVLS